MERRLAAILAADVVGYSRLIREDEAGTLAALKAHREQLIEPKVAERKGRIRRADRAVARQEPRPNRPFRAGWPPAPAAWMRSTSGIALARPRWLGIVFPVAAFPFGDLS